MDEQRTPADGPRGERGVPRGLYRVVVYGLGVCGDRLPPAAGEPQPYPAAWAQFAELGRVPAAGKGRRVRVVSEMEWHEILAQEAGLAAPVFGLPTALPTAFPTALIGDGGGLR